ncbi:MAG: AraC family transcriptional regulator [Lentisphaerae bacterium]|nr:AraC family transcriptional regulator [Lentisphaerota bacterium]
MSAILTPSSHVVHFHWAELSPVPGCPIMLFNVSGEATLAEMHTHTYLEIALVVSGKGTYRTSVEEFPVMRGDLFLLGPQDCHSYSHQEDMVVYNLLLQDQSVLQRHLTLLQEPSLSYFFDLEPRLRNRDRFKRHLRLTEEQMPAFTAVLDQMACELHEQDTRFQEMLNLLLEQFLILLCRTCNLTFGASENQLFIFAKSLRFIEDNLANPITCEQLARQAGMNTKTFYRYFKDTTGTAPIDYVIQLRLARARELLRSTDLPIKRIAAQCGFSDCSYFSQRFRRLYRLSPRQCRQAK